MLNFKKNGIFSRSTSEETTAPELQGGGVVAVWGSPGSGKTTMAVKMAKYLADKKRNVVLLLCDMTAPCCPVSARHRNWSVSGRWEAYWPLPM